MLMNTRDQYGWVARLLHWLVFGLVMGMLMGGALLSFLPAGGLKAIVTGAHKSVGVVILLLMIGRLFWRRFNPQPVDLGGTQVLNYLAHVLHVCLYTLLFLQPLSGILMSQAHGYPVAFFGLFTLPPFVWTSPALGSFFRDVHGVTAGVLTVGIAIHAAAALKHHFIDRDRTLMRMVKGR
jgi:cytochrome b561